MCVLDNQHAVADHIELITTVGIEVTSTTLITTQLTQGNPHTLCDREYRT